MSPRTVRTFTSGAVVSVALAVTGTAVFSAGPDDAVKTIEQSASRQAPTVVTPERSAVAAPRDQAVSAGVRDKALKTASLTGIPADYLAAYQRAADSIGAASPGCHLPWTLLAAIGQVESDHGRTSSRNAKGIVGVALNGNGVKQIADTDAGKLDGDTTHDRAVGPMQILPSTWATIAVDGDGDGVRDPQDIDDAALAAAVYLCGNGDDLATDTGQKAAVRSYNDSASYVALVLAVAQSYAKDQSATYAVGSMRTSGVDLRSVGTTYAGPGTGTGSGANDAGRVPSGSSTSTGTTETTGPTSGPTSGPTTNAPKPPATTPGSPTTPTTPGTPTPGGTKPPAWKQRGPVVKQTPVPRVVALDVAAALQRLEAAGFKGARVDVFDPAEVGTVLLQSITGPARPGSTVTLTVSRGPVADVVGMTYADAAAALTEQGLVVAVDPAGTPQDDAAVVAAQTPDRVAAGGTVTLTLQAPTATE